MLLGLGFRAVDPNMLFRVRGLGRSFDRHREHPSIGLCVPSSTFYGPPRDPEVWHDTVDSIANNRFDICRLQRGVDRFRESLES
jgi:hypothetical protein